MRIAVLEMYAGDRMATGERGRAIVRFLRERGHDVDVLSPPPRLLENFFRMRFSLWSRVKRRALRRRFLPHLWDCVADDLVPRIQAGRYQAVIGRLQPVAYAMTRLDRSALRIFDCANIGFFEAYHGWNADLAELEREYAKEMEIYHAADYVLMPHQLLADFFSQYVLDSPKVKTVRLGCYPAARTASYSASPRLVYAGSYSYIQDPYLLSLLTAASPYPIECYGHRNPNFSFLPARLEYRGFGDAIDFLADYQCGVITVSQDRLRRHSPSTKFAYYFAYGLPVLFPEWMEEGHSYAAAVPFSEATFASQARRVCSDRGAWQTLSEAAGAAAKELTWDHVLQPLDDIVTTWTVAHATPALAAVQVAG
jgi:hypothetical protein